MTRLSVFDWKAKAYLGVYRENLLSEDVDRRIDSLID